MSRISISKSDLIERFALEYAYIGLLNSLNTITGSEMTSSSLRKDELRIMCNILKINFIRVKEESKIYFNTAELVESSDKLGYIKRKYEFYFKEYEGYRQMEDKL